MKHIKLFEEHSNIEYYKNIAKKLGCKPVNGWDVIECPFYEKINYKMDYYVSNNSRLTLDEFIHRWEYEWKDDERFKILLSPERVYHSKKYKWYLIEKDGEYFAETVRKSFYDKVATKVLYRDMNGKVMSLTSDKKYAEEWIKSKNKIDKIDLDFSLDKPFIIEYEK